VASAVADISSKTGVYELNFGLVDAELRRLSGNPPSSRKGVLLAHRPSGFRDEMEALFRGAGFPMKLAGDTAETLLRLDEDAKPKADIMVLEKGLPPRGGVDAVRVAKRIVDIGGLSIVLLSDDAMLDRSVLEELQIRDVLTRPTAADVLRAVQRLDRNRL